MAVAVVVPCRVALPRLRAALTAVLLSLVRKFPKTSSIRICGCGAKAVPAVAVLAGWVWTVSRLAGPASTVKTLLATLPRPLALAVNCLLVPAGSIRKPVNETVPLPAPVPMSNDVVPCMGPVPLLRLNVTFRLVGKPTVELLPKASWLLTTGCVPKAEPAVALPGWLVNARALADAGLMEMVVEVALARLPLLNKRVMFVATLCDKFVNVTTPSTAVLLVAPCNVPLPALRLAVTTVELSALPLAALRRFPNWSRTWRIGCWAKATPAMAVGEGWV